MKRPVLIAGAGPVGLTLALALARRGVDVRIIDKNSSATDKSKALVVWPRTLELLDINGCAGAFIDAGLKSPRARIFASGVPLLQIDLDSAPSDFGYALMIPQAATERVLSAELAKLAVQVERNTELLSFTDSGRDEVQAVLRCADSDETVKCAYLVGCDGAHSTVRHLLKADFEGDQSPSGYVLADVIIDGNIAHDETSICWAPDGILALFPMLGGRFRIIADMGSVTDHVDEAFTLDQVQALLDARGPKGLTARDAVWTSRFTINERKVKQYSFGRVHLAGDAAHVHSPAGGQGMNTGMQDAFNLAWKMSLVWHGQARADLLDSYSIERSVVARRVLKNAGNLTKVVMLKNPILTELRRIGSIALSHVPALRQRFVDQLAETDVRYDDSPLNAHRNGSATRPAAGERARDLIVTSFDQRAMCLHALLSAGKFVLLSVALPALEVPGGLLAIASAASVASSEYYQAGHVYLIRPDAYVAMSTRGEGAMDIFDKLWSIC